MRTDAGTKIWLAQWSVRPYASPLQPATTVGTGDRGPERGGGMVDELALDTIEQVESEICRLPHVQVARIVTDGPRVTEVHIVASPGKSAKQIVRDVQSVALATFGLELDHRVVSVVQLGTNGDGGTTAIDFEHGQIDLTRPSLDEGTM